MIEIDLEGITTGGSMQETLINGQWEIILPKHRAERPEWHTEEGWEKKRLTHMCAHTRPGDVVYYIGAEEGDMAALLAKWGAKLVLFEPNDKVWPNIKAIWEANNLEVTALYSGFVSDITTQNFLTDSWPNADLPIIHDHGLKELCDPSDISQIKIDDITLYKPDVISIDVEGSEGKVLRGAEQTLRKYHPKIYLSLHPEFLHEQYGEWGAELRKWIIDLGYKETLLDYPLHEVHLYYEVV